MKNIDVISFKKNIIEYINSVVKHGDVISVNTENGNAIVISEQDYRSILESIFFSGNRVMNEILIEGKNTPIEECENFRFE